MRQRYQNWMHDWETRLTTRDTNRIVRPFDWGVEWTRGWPGVNGAGPEPHPSKPGLGGLPDGLGVPPTNSLEHFFHQLNRHIVAHSDQFFSYRTPTDFRIERHPVKLHASGGNSGDDEDRGTGKFLRFTSPVALREVAPHPSPAPLASCS